MNEKEQLGKNKIIWMIVFIFIAGLTFWTICSQSKDFSINALLSYIKFINPICIAVALLAVIGSPFFEGLSLSIIGKAYGYHITKRKGFKYAAIDLYFSAITPSATGGQPASAYFMVKDGLPLSFTTMALLINLTLYTAALTIIGIVTILICPSIFWKFSLLSKLLIIIGCVVQILLVAAIVLILFNDKIVSTIISVIIKLLHKMHLVRKPDEKIAKYDGAILSYKECVDALKGKSGLISKLFITNISQRFCQMIIPAVIFIGTGGELDTAFLIWCVQTLVVVGSYVMPIPGAMGVTDYLMIDGFAGVINHQMATNLEVVSRGLSFYMCIAMCGIVSLIAYIMVRKKGKINDRNL